MTRNTIIISLTFILLAATSGFAYWSSNKSTNKLYQYIQEVDLSLYSHRGVVNINSSKQEQTIEEQVAPIDRRFEDGDKLGALARYNALLEEDPGNIELLLRIGVIYLQENEYTLAQENLTTVYNYKESIFAQDAAWFLALLNAQYKNMDRTKVLLKEVVDNRGNYYLKAEEYLGLFN
jgi:tetratricopeptide (TPR) repeat protein